VVLTNDTFKPYGLASFREFRVGDFHFPAQWPQKSAGPLIPFQHHVSEANRRQSHQTGNTSRKDSFLDARRQAMFALTSRLSVSDNFLMPDLEQSNL
jgi:hypothetical protein